MFVSTGYQQVVYMVLTTVSTGFQQSFQQGFNRVSTVFSTGFQQVFHQPVGVYNVKKGLQTMCIYTELNLGFIHRLKPQVEPYVLNTG